jgi:hypothetical protein
MELPARFLGILVMTPQELLGRRVKVLAWNDLRPVLPAEPCGTVTHVADFGAVDVELTVRVEGLARPFLFGLDEVELLNYPVEGRSEAAARVH